MENIMILNSLRANAIEREGNTLRVSGYACHFNSVNHNGELVTADSFAGWLQHLADNGKKPTFTYNHDSNKLIGGWDEMTADETGLFVRGHINTDVAFVRDELLPLIEAGDLACLSTEGWASGEYDDERKAYVCDTFMLTAISLVALPADFDANISLNRLSQKTDNKKTLKTLKIY